jgi:hypothetical protein
MRPPQQESRSEACERPDYTPALFELFDAVEKFLVFYGAIGERGFESEHDFDGVIVGRSFRDVTAE